MTTYPTTAPPLTPLTERINLRFDQSVLRSPFSGSTQVVHNFAEWQVELGFAPQTLTNANTYLAWLSSLRGSWGTFTYRPKGSGKSITGKTLSATAPAEADSISVGTFSGATNLVAGDYLTISDRLHRIISVPATGSGSITIFIEPMLRASVASGTSVNFQTPSVILRLVSEADAPPGYSRDTDAVYLDILRAIESI